jgi:hypothetical protein
MKKELLSFLMLTLFFFNFSYGQVAINTTGSNANASAMLDVESTTKGMLVPRMTTAQRTAIASPATGLLVYDNTTSSFWFYNGSAWTELITGTSVGWKLTGNSGTDTSVNFVGTTDDHDLKFRVNNLRAGTIATTGNVFLGVGSGNQNTGLYNVGLGSLTLSNNTNGTRNTAVGRAVLFNSNAAQNTAIGFNSMFSNTSGGANTAIGDVSLQFNTTGNGNTAIGQASLFNNTTGYSNVAIGIDALSNNTIKSNLVAIGDSALYNNGIGASSTFEAVSNVAVGSKSLYSNTRGTGNIGLGSKSLYTLNGGNGNIGLGERALTFLSNGSFNIGIGFTSAALTKGSSNVLIGNSSSSVIGTDSLINNVIVGSRSSFALKGGQNVLLGYNAGGQTIAASGNVAIGDSSLGASNNVSNSGYSNVAVGNKALTMNTSISNLVAVGDSALYNNGTGASVITDGTANTALGSKTLFSNTIGDANTASGNFALYSNTIGSHNTANGRSALRSNIDGNHNTAVGYNALYNNVSGSHNTAIGFDADVTGVGTISNATAIGSNAWVSQSNSLVLGSVNGVNSATSDVNVGIGTTAPNHALEIRTNSVFGGKSQLLLYENENDYARLKFQNNTNSNYWDIAGATSTTASNARLNFYYNGFGDVMSIGGNGRVGIGTTNPASELEVNGQVKITGGSPGTGKVLTSDATGLASWQNASPKVAFRAWMPSLQTLSNAVDTKLVFSTSGTTDCFNDGNAFDNVTNSFIAPVAGVYHFTASFNLQSPSGTYPVNINFKVNGSTMAQNTIPNYVVGSYVSIIILETTIKLSAGDAVTVTALQASTSSATTFNGAATRFEGFQLY